MSWTPSAVIATDSLRALAPEGDCWSSGSPWRRPTVVNRLLLSTASTCEVGWGAYAFVRPGFISSGGRILTWLGLARSTANRRRSTRSRRSPQLSPISGSRRSSREGRRHAEVMRDRTRAPGPGMPRANALVTHSSRGVRDLASRRTSVGFEVALTTSPVMTTLATCGSVRRTRRSAEPLPGSRAIRGRRSPQASAPDRRWRRARLLNSFDASVRRRVVGIAHDRACICAALSEDLHEASRSSATTDVNRQTTDEFGDPNFSRSSGICGLKIVAGRVRVLFLGHRR